MRTRRARATGILIIGLAIAGCSGPAPKVTPPGLGDVTVSLVATRFEPKAVDVAVGHRVVWNWTDKVGHNVIADNAAFVASPVQYGGSYSIRFDKPGTYAYQCTLHDGMRGTVTVR